MSIDIERINTIKMHDFKIFPVLLVTIRFIFKFLGAEAVLYYRE
ncbi:MAG: hypothetical protein ACTSWN_06850 [Promethearchaeota archaeon]